MSVFSWMLNLKTCTFKQYLTISEYKIILRISAQGLK